MSLASLLLLHTSNGESPHQRPSTSDQRGGERREEEEKRRQGLMVEKRKEEKAKKKNFLSPSSVDARTAPRKDVGDLRSPNYLKKKKFCWVISTDRVIASKKK